MNKKLIFLMLVCMSFNVTAAGYSQWAVPTTVEIVSGGVLINGDFGDPNSCGKADYIFVKQQSATYESILSMSLSALHAKKKCDFMPLLVVK